LTDIDRPGVKVIANPGGTNERFDRARLHAADIVVYPDNLTIFDQLATGRADLMITDASETRFQAKLHPGMLCAIHPDQPFDFAEKAYWMVPDPALKAFVDQWLHLMKEDGEFDALYAKWFR
jgi:cyclohexadienyl dehydratase